MCLSYRTVRKYNYIGKEIKTPHNSPDETKQPRGNYYYVAYAFRSLPMHTYTFVPFSFS